MPAKFDLSWEPKSRRWWKQYEGRRHVVSCRQLVKLGYLPANSPETKEGTYQAANAWWANRLAEAQGLKDAEPPKPVPRHITIEILKKRLQWAEDHGHLDIVTDYKARLAKAERIAAHTPSTPAEKKAWMEGLDREYPFPTDMEERLRDARNLGMKIDSICLPGLLDRLVGEGQVWTERLRTAKATQIPTEKSVGGLSQRFLKLSEARVEGGELSASEHDLACRCVTHFAEWIGKVSDPTVITPEKWEAYWHHLRGMISAGTRSREYAKKDWRYARAFVEWMASMDKLAMPKNLHDRRYKIGETRNAVETFTPEEVRNLVGAAPGQLKLHLLLMLNCGFYQSDISDLRKDEVDLERGYITRQRSKTRQHHGDKIPVVRYKLWPVTLELLRAHISQHPVLALTTRQGLPWVETKVENHRVKSRRDGIKSNFAHIARRLKIEKPLKVFRKTSATRLDSEARFARYAPFFLGHAGRTVAEEHYLDRGGRPFDEAIDWLGVEYGFTDKPGGAPNPPGATS